MSANPAEIYDESLKLKLEKSIEELSEHFEAVLIIASNTLDTRMGKCSRFSDHRGNFYLVEGMAMDFVQQHQNKKLARQIREALKDDDE